MRLFLKGAVLFGGLFAFLCFCALVFEDNRTIMATLRPIGRVMEAPVWWVFEAFHLHDDDPRIIYPMMLSTLLWGLAGGGLAVTAGHALAAVRGRRHPKPRG